MCEFLLTHRSSIGFMLQKVRQTVFKASLMAENGQKCTHIPADLSTFQFREKQYCFKTLLWRLFPPEMSVNSFNTNMAFSIFMEIKLLKK